MNRGTTKMECITLAEFNDYLRAKQPKTIIYNDDNNSEYKSKYERYRVLQPSYISLVFNNIYIDYNTVILKMRSGYIRLNDVEKVYLNFNASVLGDVATLYCKNKDYKVAYTLIIR